MSSIGTWLKPVKLKEVLPLTNGLFEHILDTDYEFKCDVTKAQLDYLLMANYAHRSTSPAVDLIHDDDEDVHDELTDTEMTTLAYMMLNYYKPKWDKLGEIYDIEYDPIHNYLDEWEDEMDETDEGTVEGNIVTTDRHNVNVANHNVSDNNLTERTTYGKIDTHAINSQNPLKERTTYNSNDTHTIDANAPITEEITYGKTDTKRGEENTINSGSDTNSIWGFNSSDAVNSDRTTLGTSNRHTFGDPSQGNNPMVETLGGKDTTVKTGSNSDTKGGYDEVTKSGSESDTLSGNDTTTNTGTVTDDGYTRTTGDDTRTVDDDRTRTDTIDRDRSGRHFGNIGNLTSQKMLKEEIELWKWNYVQTILEDARDFLTIPIYM